MDWAKAKTILIILFLLLNVFLFITLLDNNAVLTFKSDYARYATEFLQTRNIHIEAEIPNVKGKAGVLAFGSRAIDLEALSQTVFGKKVPAVQKDGITMIKDGDESIIIKGQTLTLTDKLSMGTDLYQDDKAFQDMLYDYLWSMGIQKKELSLPSKTLSGDQRIYDFYMTYKEYLLFEQPIQAILNREGVMTLTLPTREVKRIQSPSEILSVYQVLVMGQLPQNATLSHVAFGFKRIGANDLFDSPVWHIRLEDGQSLYYNAYTGERVQ